MQNINIVAISGNLVRDAELRATQGGMSLLNFTVAVNDRRKEGDEWVDKPNYIDCKLFGPRAESLHRFLVKGTKVLVAGKLSWYSWERDGQRRSKVVVNVEQVETPPKAKPAIQESYVPEDIPF